MARVGSLLHQWWRDALIVVVFAFTAGTASYHIAAQVDSRLLGTWEVWFQSDTERIYSNMTDRWSAHYRTSVHPLFSLLTSPPVYALRTVFHLDRSIAVRLFISTVTALSIAAVFTLLRLLGCRRFDAVVFSLLMATSASSMFWFIVPETWALGSFSIVLALILVTVPGYPQWLDWRFVLVSALTLSVTITNWMAGIFATFVSYSWRRALTVTGLAFCLVTLLWGIEKLIFPTTAFFLTHLQEENRFILTDFAVSPVHVLNSFLFHSMIMPAIKTAVIACEGWPARPLMITQLSWPGSGTAFGRLDVGLWVALLMLGGWALFSVRSHRRLRITLGLTLVGQLALHLLYGEETFLYSLHFGPLLVVLTALATLTRARVIALALAMMLVVGGSINNGLQLRSALQYLPQFFSDDRVRIPTGEYERQVVFAGRTCQFTTVELQAIHTHTSLEANP